MRIAPPALPADPETQIPLGEAAALTLGAEAPLEGFFFDGGSLAGAQYPRAEARGCVLRGAVVTAQQACELARLLGVIIK